MKHNKTFVLGMSAILLAFGLVLAGCDTGGGGDNPSGPESLTKRVTVTIKNEATVPITGILIESRGYKSRVYVGSEGTVNYVPTTVSIAPGQTYNSGSLEVHTSRDVYNQNLYTWHLQVNADGSDGYRSYRVFEVSLEVGLPDVIKLKFTGNGNELVEE